MLFRRRKRRKRPRGVLACMECGSHDIIKTKLIDGPVVYEHMTSDSVYCKTCKHTGIPMVFSTEEERLAYQEELSQRK